MAIDSFRRLGVVLVKLLFVYKTPFVLVKLLLKFLCIPCPEIMDWIMACFYRLSTVYLSYNDSFQTVPVPVPLLFV
jgi:hypothetical protein